MLRFTIRDVLWLTVVVGMGVAWWLDHCREYEMYNKQLLWQAAVMGAERVGGGSSRWVTHPSTDNRP